MSSAKTDRGATEGSPLARDLEALREHLQAVASTPSDEADEHPALAFSLPALRLVLELKELRRALLNPDAGLQSRTSLHAMLVDIVLDGLQSTSGELPGPQRQVAEFLVGSFLSLCLWWLRDARELSPDAIDEVYRALAAGGLHG